MRRRNFLLLALLLLLAAWLPAGAEDTPEQLRARLAAETDLIRKARLAVRLAELELEGARKDYAGGDWDKGKAGLEQMLGYVEQAYTHLTETHRDPRRKPSGFKDTEIKLRVFLRRLEDLRSSLPLDERPVVEKVVASVREIQQDLLEGVLRVKTKKKEE